MTLQVIFAAHFPPFRAEHLAAATEPEAVGRDLRAMDGYEGTLPVRCALRLAPLVSYARVNCAMPNGQTSTWTERSGATP